MAAKHDGLCVRRLCTIEINRLTLYPAEILPRTRELSLAVCHGGTKGGCLCKSAPIAVDLSAGVVDVPIVLRCAFQYKHTFSWQWAPSASAAHSLLLFLQSEDELLRERKEALAWCSLDLRDLVQKPVLYPGSCLAFTRTLSPQPSQTTVPHRGHGVVVVCYAYGSISSTLHPSEQSAVTCHDSSLVPERALREAIANKRRSLNDDPSPRVSPQKVAQTAASRSISVPPTGQGNGGVVAPRACAGEWQPCPLAFVAASELAEQAAGLKLDQLSHICYWASFETSHVAFPSPAKLAELGYSGLTVLVRSASQIAAVVEMHTAALEQSSSAVASLRVSIVGNDALLCRVLSSYAMQIRRRRLHTRLSFYPHLSAGFSHLNDSDLLEFFSCFVAACRDMQGGGAPDIFTPKVLLSPKEVIVQLCHLHRNCTQLHNFPVGTACLSGPSGSTELYPFAKNVEIACGKGLDMTYYTHTDKDGLKKHEMRKDPCCVAILRIPTKKLGFKVSFGEKGKVDFRCVAQLRVWTSRSLERGLLLQPQTHAPTILQSSLYGKLAQRVVCCCREEGEMSLIVDGERVAGTGRTTSVTVTSDGGHIDIALA